MRPNSNRSTTQFICIGAFHARVSDPLIGGTYITVCIFCIRSLRSVVEYPQLLNTVTNLGGTWPRFFVLRGTVQQACDDCRSDLMSRHTAIDYFTIATCEVDGDSTSLTSQGSSNPCGASCSHR